MYSQNNKKCTVKTIRNIKPAKMDTLFPTVRNVTI